MKYSRMRPGMALPSVTARELCDTAEFANLAAQLPEVTSRLLVSMLYEANGTHARGFDGFDA